MLVELGVVEQRYAAVLEVVRDGSTVTEVAARYGVTRQTVHRWLRRYAAKGLAGLVDQSPRPDWCPHQMPPVVEARIVELRRANPGWGPRTLLFRLEAEGVVPLPGRSSVYRALVRHGLIEPVARRRRKADYKRWERARPMELWQMDVVGGVMVADGWKASIVSGLDDHSRFVVSAHVVRRATARPVSDALGIAMRAHGVPAQILTDNGKVERWHKTLRRDFLNGKVFDSIETAQAQVDGWVREYNFERRHQGIGDVVPWERFRLAREDHAEPVESTAVEPSTTRKVGGNGKISFASELYKVGGWLAGETVEVAIGDGLVSIHHRGVLVATHAQRHRLAKETKALARKAKQKRPRSRQATVGQTVTRKVDSSGNVSFAATNYSVGLKHRRRQVQVAIVDSTVEISSGGEIIKVHPIRHDRSREHGAFANPGGKANRINAA